MKQRKKNSLVNNVNEIQMWQKTRSVYGGTDYSKMSWKLFAEILWKIFLLNTIKTIILVNITKILHKLKSIIQNIFLNEDVNHWELVNNTATSSKHKKT